MQTFHIYKNLAWLNDLPADEAEDVFLDCCGSSKWARRMAAARPFPLLDDLFHKAERVWFALTPGDWLEAFAAHPKIGSKKAAPAQGKRAAQWSAVEQSGMFTADDYVKVELAEANSLYEQRFGFIFIVCASGKSPDEMLAICNARLKNSAETEMRIAADEQRKITEIRLNKLLEK
ncbi:2-oxo-4-hydroxy-4-carboxy-5-ureidoimidazoline decarboxylase [soil metagenome]